MTWAYYNEHNAFAAAWLRELIVEGVIAPGEVDERDIREVEPADLGGFDQCHFFAGIGGWSYALRLAGWADDRPVWTGSCPCQPFSAAGKGAGFDDERHLWPAWFRLIRECRPVRCFGEQVANPAGLGWFDLVSTDLEAEGYAVGQAVLGAHSAGAPHIRQRLFFVADAGRERTGGAGSFFSRGDRPNDGVPRPNGSTSCPLADPRRSGDERGRRRGPAHGAAGEDQGAGDQRERRGADAWDRGADGFPLGNPFSAGLEERDGQRHGDEDIARQPDRVREREPGKRRERRRLEVGARVRNRPWYDAGSRAGPEEFTQRGRPRARAEASNAPSPYD